MKSSFHLPSHTFSSLEFSPDEAAAYQALAHDLVQERLRQYDDYVHDQNRHIDARQWKLVKRKERLSIYKQRTHPTCNVDLQTIGGGVERIETTATTPWMRTVGHVVGTLDDAMFGAFADSNEAIRLRTSYLKDEIDDARVLATFATPSLDDPYRFCGLVWLTSQGFHCPFVRRRDMVLLVAMGLTQSLQTKERVGFYLMHSVRLPQIPELYALQLIRLKMSACYLLRQSVPDLVEVFQNGFFAPMGHMPEFALVVNASISLASAGNTVQASYAKKLAWLFTQTRHCPPTKRSARDHQCGGCRIQLTAKHASQCCIVCKFPICGRCKVYQKITIHVTPRGFAQKSLLFCVACVLKAKQTDALVVAQQYVRERLSSMSSGSRQDHPTPIASRLSSSFGFETNAPEASSILLPAQDPTYSSTRTGILL